MTGWRLRLYITCALGGAGLLLLKFFLLPDRMKAGDWTMFSLFIIAAIVAALTNRGKAPLKRNDQKKDTTE